MGSPDMSEVRVVRRPLKLIAFICACIGVVILGASLTTSHWLEGKGFHQGLWEYCYVTKRSPNGESGLEQCRPTTDRLWTVICGVLCVAALLAAVVACLLTFLGLLSRNVNARKRRPALYITSAFLVLLAVVCQLVAVIIFPVMLLREIEDYRSTFNITDWLFSWSYGLAWGAWLFLVGAATLLLVNCPRSEKDNRREKDYYNTNMVMSRA